MKNIERLAIVCISLSFAAIAQAQINVVTDTESITATGMIKDPTNGTQSFSHTAQSGTVGGTLGSPGTGPYANSQAQQTSSITNNLVQVSGSLEEESKTIFSQAPGYGASASVASDFSLVFTTDSLSTYSFTGYAMQDIENADVFGLVWDFSLQGASSGVILNDTSLEMGSASGFLAPDTYTLAFDASFGTGPDPDLERVTENDQFSLGLTSVPDSGIGLLGFAITMVCLCGVLPRLLRRAAAE